MSNPHGPTFEECLADLIAEYDERSADTEDGNRYPWGVAADDLRQVLAQARPSQADA